VTNREWGKDEIRRQLHAIVISRLFSDRPWLADREILAGLRRVLHEMKVEEPVPGTTDSRRNTALGLELNMGLIEVFLGSWDEWEVPMILSDNCLIDEQQADDLYHRLGRGDDPELVLRAVVKQAYVDYYGRSKMCH
jgi:hypothetical protein